MSQKCMDCKYCFEDTRSHVYTRHGLYFCRKRGNFFSRNYKIGEQTRIDPDGESCLMFEPKEK